MPCGWTIKRLFLYTIRYFFTLQNWRIFLHDNESFCSIKSFVCFVVLFVSQIILPNKNFLLLGDQKNLFLTSNSNLLRNTFSDEILFTKTWLKDTRIVKSQYGRLKQQDTNYRFHKCWDLKTWPPEGLHSLYAYRTIACLSWLTWC